MEQQQQLSTQDVYAQLLDSVNKKDPISFEQKSNDMSFDQVSVSKLGLSRPIVVMALGSASAGLFGGTIASVLPLGSLQALAGLPTIIAGMLMRMTIGKSGNAKDFSDGVLIAGISQTVSRFIPSSFAQVKEGFSQTVKQEFKQESKPCDDDIKQLRNDVSW
jgi:hypothetical protein